MTHIVARLLLGISAALVPGDRRGEWLEEWRAELRVLDGLRARPDSDAAGLPGPIGFAAGAIPHALWMRTEGWTMDSVLQDIRFSARSLRRAPAFTSVAALTLALGIGANASIFSLVNGLLLRAPAEIEEPGRLVQIARSYESAPRWDNFSWPALKLIEAEADALSGVAGYSARVFVIGSGTDVTSVVGEYVTGNYFEVLGVRPALGRLLQPYDEGDPGASRVVVLGYGAWATRFGSDPGIVGRTVSIGSEPYEVVGVAPEGFVGVVSLGSPPELWVPATQRPENGSGDTWTAWGHSWISAVGRISDGVRFEQAVASMSPVAVALREASADNLDMEVLLSEGVGLEPEERTEATRLAGVLGLIVVVVLLLTCTNVANLFLARASGRRTEAGVRMAMGAGRGRLTRHLLTESLVLAGLSTVLAAPIVLCADRLLPLLFPFRLAVPVGPDASVYLFTMAVGLLAGILFGVAPAWASSRGDLASSLRESSSTAGASSTRLRDGLVVAQLGLSLGLVFGAALLSRSMANAHGADPGFVVDGLTAGMVNLGPTGRYDDPILATETMLRMVEVARSTPGVDEAAFASQAPLAGWHARRSVRPLGRDDVSVEAEFNVVGDGYFDALGIPVVEGRALGGLEDEPEPVVVVNEALAAMFWPGQTAVGQYLQGEPTRRVVGVVGDVQMRSLRSPGLPGVYWPVAHDPVTFGVVHVRGTGGTAPEASVVRAIAAEVDPEVPVDASGLRDAITTSMNETRTFAMLVGAFAVLALVLAAVGLYGLVSYGAAQRVREMGIRIALGAQPESLVRLFLTRGVGIAVLGIALGLAVAIFLASAMENLLYGVTPRDPIVLVATSLLLLGTATLASWIPARRASRVDAALSLRGE